MVSEQFFRGHHEFQFLHPVRSLNHVAVGQDESIRRDDKARAAPASFLARPPSASAGIFLMYVSFALPAT
jgi:hypothetical protein